MTTPPRLAAARRALVDRWRALRLDRAVGAAGTFWRERGPRRRVLGDLWRALGELWRALVAFAAGLGPYVRKLGQYVRKQGPVVAAALGRLVRALARALARKIVLELSLVVAASAGLAVFMTWPALQDPAHTIPTTSLDPLIETWAIGWSGHGLLDQFSHLFDGNTFYPASLSLAFTDPMIGYGPVTWFIHGPEKALVAYNIIFAFTPALACVGAYALARQLGAHPLAAAVAGLGFAYAPWRAGQAAHLHVLSTGPFVLALAMLARGHGFSFRGRKGRYRPVWAALGWLVAAWQVTIGFAVGLPFAYLLAIVGVVSAVAWLARGMPRVPLRLVAVDVAGGAAFAAVGGLVARPFLEVAEVQAVAVEHARSLAQVAHYSPTWEGLFAPPATVNGTWTDLARTTFGHLPETGEVRLLPGFTLIALALVGLFVSTWRWWWRLPLGVATVLFALMSLGTNFAGAESFGFVALYDHVPGWAGIRTPGRLVILTTLGLALLAAGAVSRLLGRRPAAAPPRVWVRNAQIRRVTRWAVPIGAAVLSLALSVLVAVEGFARVSESIVRDPPAAFLAAPAPTMVVPSVWTFDSTVMYWSTMRGFPQIGNGASGITPLSLTALRTEMWRFPDERSASFLRANGYRSVVYLRGLGDKQAIRADKGIPDPSLGLTRIDFGDAVLFLVDPAPQPSLAKAPGRGSGRTTGRASGRASGRGVRTPRPPTGGG